MYHDLLKTLVFWTDFDSPMLTFPLSQLENSAASVVNDVVLHTKAGSTCLGFEQAQMVRRNWEILEQAAPSR